MFRKLSGRLASYTTEEEYFEIAGFLANTNFKDTKCRVDLKTEDTYEIR